MSESNYNWVCFDCRSAVRQPKTAQRIPKCRKCGADSFCLGYKVEVPGKLNVRGWRKLETESRKRRFVLAYQQGIKRVHEIHAAEKRIAYLRSLPANRDRKKLIAELRKKLRV